MVILGLDWLPGSAGVVRAWSEYRKRKDEEAREERARIRKEVAAYRAQTDGLIELHRHFNENDTVLTQAVARMKGGSCILHPVHIRKLGVPHEPFGLSEQHLAALDEKVRQRLFFFKRLLPNLEIEIDEAVLALQGRRYDEAMRWLTMLYAKNSYMLCETVVTYLIVTGRAASNSVDVCDQAMSRAARDIELMYPRPIDKERPKHLFFIDTSQDPPVLS